ncbi:MAG TPA: GRAM domain-containing protein [Beutenbergiaceae bacterium]|nr:GRAM domain-containing protein [Beutenbergiaceae bacterium]
MRTALNAGEQVIKSGAANVQRGVETAGGKVYLTGHRLIFEPHRLNIQRQDTQIPLVNITGTRLCWTKFLGFIPLMPNSLAVDTADGTEYRFVLNGRKKWQQAIGAP